MWRGIPRIYAKQLAKKKKISPKQKAAMQNFVHLSRMAKWVTPQEVDMAVRMSKGTQYLWRDLLYMTYSGRLFNFQIANGPKVFSVAARTTTSDILDAISQVPGTMLWRGPNWWDVIETGDAGQVLTYQGEDTPPIWAAPGGGGAPLSCTLARSAAGSASSSWPQNPVFQSAIIDEFGGWDAGQPDRVLLPSAAGKFRVTATLPYDGAVTNGSFYVALWDPVAGAAAPDQWLTYFYKLNLGWSGAGPTINTGWLPKGSLTAIALTVGLTPTDSLAIGAEAMLTVEVDAM